MKRGVILSHKLGIGYVCPPLIPPFRSINRQYCVPTYLQCREYTSKTWETNNHNKLENIQKNQGKIENVEYQEMHTNRVKKTLLDFVSELKDCKYQKGKLRMENVEKIIQEMEAAGFNSKIEIIQNILFEIYILLNKIEEAEDTLHLLESISVSQNYLRFALSFPFSFFLFIFIIFPFPFPFPFPLLLHLSTYCSLCMSNQEQVFSFSLAALFSIPLFPDSFSFLSSHPLSLQAIIPSIFLLATCI